ncbi:NmrA family protein [Kribbella flavida DSM 17836]|uniref:NmrA family protein n=1 Tax=Kribbella flavida (strain DSM 17836 / JCM 10339 / NBRC 14399) TaxID=479435 RepID=D2PWN4_KRIFD|nr:NmrA family NAD(P)-binding protein [Kribbella flavida]ADB33503.1 NmrA family protein [Kribbella flavida DSM 17836]
MNHLQHPIAVIGATGQQGSSVVEALLDQRQAVRALVRDPASAAARALEARGVDVVAADQQDSASLQRGLTDVAALFFMTTFEGSDGTEGEVRRGVAVADAAARAGVPHVVYSSVGGAERATGIPHFESKYQVERRLSQVVPATFLRPTFFMENLSPQLAAGESDELVLRLPVPSDVPLQMIAVRDIGAAAARVLLQPEAVVDDAVELGGDELTMAQVAERTAAAHGRPTRYEELPLDVLGDDEDLRAMFRWFRTVPAYRADFDVTRRLVPEVHDFARWVAERTGVRAAASA